MVLGRDKGSLLARSLGLDALFLLRGKDGVTAAPVGPLFAG
jgi:hypothetical protein